MGSCTDCRGMMPGALTSTRERVQLSSEALAVDGLAEAVDDAAEELLADGDVDDGAGALDGVALEDVAIVSEDDDTDVVVLKVEGHAAEAAGEVNHLPGLHVGEPVDAGDTVTDGDDGAGLGVLGDGVLGSGAADLGLEVGREFEGLRRHGAGGGLDGRPAGDLGREGRKRRGKGKGTETCGVRRDA